MRDHPKVAFRDCRDCQKYVYDEETGERELWRGKPYERPKNTKPPCGYAGEYENGTSACPKGNPISGNGFMKISYRVYHHYLRCDAVGRFPDDELVAEHALICKSNVR